MDEPRRKQPRIDGSAYNNAASAPSHRNSRMLPVVAAPFGVLGPADDVAVLVAGYDDTPAVKRLLFVADRCPALRQRALAAAHQRTRACKSVSVVSRVCVFCDCVSVVVAFFSCATKASFYRLLL
jgi:hypothetical protein